MSLQPLRSLNPVILSIQAFKSKYWIVYPTLVLGCLIEIMGWSARLWSHLNVLLLTPFLMQICTLIMAPVFFSAYDYIILGLAINKLGARYSILKPGYYFTLFIIADLISLVLQAVGGGQAASSAGDSAPTDTATDIMVAGIIFQLVSMGIFVILGFDFIVRANSNRAYGFRIRQIIRDEEKKKRKDSQLTHVESDSTIVQPTHDDKLGQENIEGRENMTRWWIMLGGCLISSIAIVVRGIYRSYELSQGWESKVVQTEILQNVLDGIMMLIAVGVFVFINPLYLLPKRTSWKGYH